MKKTLIALMALAGVAAAEDWTATFTSSNTSKDQTYTHYSTAFTEGCPLTMDITQMVITGTGNQVNGTYAANAGNNTTSIRPNANVGNGGTYTITFKLTNTSDDVIVLDQITFESFAYNSGGSLQEHNDNVNRNVIFTLNGGIDGKSAVVYTANGLTNKAENSDAVITFAPIELTQNAHIEFSLNVTEGNGCEGTFVGLKGATFSGEIVAPVIPDTPAVPEPATATLSLLALAGLAVRRRRK